MMGESAPVLEYSGPPPNAKWRGWIFASASGVIGGSLLSFSYVVFCFLAPAIGLLVGTLAATLAPTHKFKFGLLGVGLCIVSTYGMVTIQNLRGGFPLSLHDEVIRLGFIAGLVGVTGLGGCAGVAAIGWRGEVKVSEDLVSRHIAEHEME